MTRYAVITMTSKSYLLTKMITEEAIIIIIYKSNNLLGFCVSFICSIALWVLVHQSCLRDTLRRDIKFVKGVPHGHFRCQSGLHLFCHALCKLCVFYHLQCFVFAFCGLISVTY